MWIKRSLVLYLLLLLLVYPASSSEVTGTETAPKESSVSSKVSTAGLSYLWNKLKNKVSDLRDNLKEVEKKLTDSETALKESQLLSQGLEQQLEKALITSTSLTESLGKLKEDLEKQESLIMALSAEIEALKEHAVWWSIGSGLAGTLLGIVVE